MDVSIPKPTKDDLLLAWKRMHHDRPDKVFVVHPFASEWIKQDLNEWLVEIADKLENGFTPSASLPCPAPKPEYLIRPGSVLTMKDELVYTYLVGQLYSAIHDKLWENQGDPDIAHSFPKQTDSDAWIRSDWKIWSKWREDSVTKSNSSEFVLFTDIVGFYDNIELAILASDLKAVCGDSPYISLLMSCLNRWSQPRGRGIPQGYSASHVLAKVYLHTLDHYLNDNGYSHLRYVDDIRIFCTEKIQAQKAIILIGKFLSKRGLNLQGAKTKILSKADALVEIDGVSPIIEEIQGKLIEELQSALAASGSTTSEYALLDALESSNDPPLELLEAAFDEHIANGEFDKTLFHYLLTRLGKAKSKIATTYCIDSLLLHPEETGSIFRYFEAVGLDEAGIAAIRDYFQSDSCIYEYQVYQFTKWCVSQTSLPEQFIALARSWAFDGGLPEWVRSNAVAILGRHGSHHDYETVEANYDIQTSELARADCIYACRYQEKARRNAFYAKSENDGKLVAMAVKYAKIEI